MEGGDGKKQAKKMKKQKQTNNEDAPSVMVAELYEEEAAAKAKRKRRKEQIAKQRKTNYRWWRKYGHIEGKGPLVADPKPKTHAVELPCDYTLGTAVQVDDLRATQLCADKGADMANWPPVHDQPLHRAARAGSYSCARTLWSCGADVDSVNKDGLTPLLLATLGGPVQGGVHQDRERHRGPRVEDREEPGEDQQAGGLDQDAGGREEADPRGY